MIKRELVHYSSSRFPLDRRLLQPYGNESDTNKPKHRASGQNSGLRGVFVFLFFSFSFSIFLDKWITNPGMIANCVLSCEFVSCVSTLVSGPCESARGGERGARRERREKVVLVGSLG